MLDKSDSYSKERANDILEVIMSYARLDFNSKTKITGNDDIYDAIGTGVNMLGEELENSVISLQEKEHLLKEIHHRVKNNMQIISSLLNLQAQNTDDERFLAMIRESKNRIFSMALIHEMLYITKNISQINVSQYITKLSQSVYQSFSAGDFSIEFDYDIDDTIFFETDNMVPIGLIINEIMSNTMKHAFPNKKGIIAIKFCKKENDYFLQVKDNGVGIPEHFDYTKSKSLGMQLIHILSEQLDGKLTLDSKNGTKYELCFNIPNNSL